MELKAMRHSTEHLLQMAVKKIYPHVQMAMGPATEDGFYFDFELSEKLNEEIFPKLEKEIYHLINKALPIEQEFTSVAQARQLFKDNPYKQEWLNEIEKKGEPVSLYWIGKGTPEEFVDLCSGPHLENTNQIGTIKLLSIAGAYWHGDENKQMLTRIYGTAFPSKEELQNYLYLLEEAKKRDHRKLGQELELFIIDEEVGKGLPLWLPKGAFLRNQLIDFALKTYYQHGYLPVATPHIGSKKLWETSGHWNFYRDSIYEPFGIDEEQYLLKPMNCPFHVKIYQASQKSYRDLPIRYTEMGTVYRYEKTGELSGLTRVRGFTQDDGHIICRPDQLHDELIAMIKLTKYIWETLGMKDFEVSLSVGDDSQREKYLGSLEDWQTAEGALEKALAQENIPYTRYPGEAAFYGPKADFLFKDSLGRKWQCSTIQVDFNLPLKFQMEYTDANGQKVQPIMLHRALLGSIERSMAILIEHYAGAFPLWLSPNQIVIIPISDKLLDYAQNIFSKLSDEGLRVFLNNEAESLPKKIRNAEKQKIPYMIILGEKELEQQNLSVRGHGNQNLGNLNLEEFITRVKKEIKDKK